MQNSRIGKIIWFLGILLALWLGGKYLLPVLLPFLLGAVIALAAEPAVRFGTGKLHMSRPLAAGLGVSLTLLLSASVVWLVGALAVKELGNLAGKLPDVEATVEQGVDMLRQWSVQLTNRLPEKARRFAAGTTEKMFDSTNVLQGQLTNRIPTMVRSVLGWLPGGALGIGTGVLAGFMLSVRLPKLRLWLQQRLPSQWQEKYLPALKRIRSSVLSWLKAQLKLSAVTWGIVTVGFLLLQIPYGPFWAFLVAVVDAVPVLGTGTVLLPWALVELLQGEGLRALGLVLIYGLAFLTRTLLEPKLVGRHLGLDPLVTLVCLYAGYRFWGIGGMILAPMLTAAVKGAVQPQP